MKYDYITTAIVLGPANSGKSTFINTYIKKNTPNYATIGVDFHKFQLKHNNNFYQLKLWDTGKGLLYRNIINDFLKKSHIYIIINNKNYNNYDFINQTFEIINSNNNNNPKLILFIYNKINLNDNFKYNEELIKKNNKHILMKFFYINVTKKNEVNIIFDYIKYYIDDLKHHISQNTIVEKSKISCCNIC